jgi:hypothetical protein
LPLLNKGFIGQPTWHPNGDYLLLQMENDNSDHSFYEHMAWGINNDLWLASFDGTIVEKIWCQK